MANDASSPKDRGGRIHPAKSPAPALDGRAMLSGLIKVIWVVTVMFWPFIKWFIALDCVIQLIKTIYFWDTPGSHAGLVFLLHFFALSALTFFVGAYEPKGL